ncbi:MAG TPA: CAP domain-containing protein [Solirubrobacteraceae bacterium]|nr:CAP domain-containing protein [Solirubrobacteraceae bacterium]
MKIAADAVEAAAAAAQAGKIAKALATPCQNTQLIPEAGNLALVRAAVLCLINTERAQNGKEPLSPDPRLERAAEGHAKEMLSLDYFDHVSPSGLTPVQRIRTTGYIPGSEVGYVIGENLAWGTLTLATPQAIVTAWIASSEHLANILEGKYVDTGIDIEPEVPESLAEGVAGALYTQEFGVIVH